MPEIINRQVVNIALNAATLNPANIGFSLRFLPDIVIVRQVSYSSTEVVSNNLYQVFSDLVPDQILCYFTSFGTDISPNSQFTVRTGFMGGMVSFQIQLAPVSPGTSSGPGPLTVEATGNLGLILEFQKIEA